MLMIMVCSNPTEVLPRPIAPFRTLWGFFHTFVRLQQKAATFKIAAVGLKLWAVNYFSITRAHGLPKPLLK
jgi:hypothetical protein